MSATTSSSTSTATSTTSSSMSSSTAPSSTSSSISSQASALVHHSKDSMMALGNRPTSMTCNGCAATLTIPPSIWQWQCSNNHINQYGISKCPTCHEPRGASISWPAMLCDRCGTVTTVPGSEVESTLKGTFASLRSSLHGFIDPPKIFHCENCNTSLVVPQGPWACQACTQVNGETVNKCMKCSQLKGAQRVLCGHCHKATSIPESGFVDILKSGTASLSRIVNKGWMDLVGTPNVECPSCRHPVKLPTNVTSHTTPTTTTSSTTAPSSTTTAAVSNSALPPAPQGVPVTEWSIPLVCDSCHHSFSVGKGSVTDPQANVNQPWKGAAGLIDPAAVPSMTGGKGVDMQVALVAPPDLQTTSAATSTGSTATTKYSV